jgi:hypothetical protein
MTENWELATENSKQTAGSLDRFVEQPAAV